MIIELYSRVIFAILPTYPIMVVGCGRAIWSIILCCLVLLFYSTFRRLTNWHNFTSETSISAPLIKVPEGMAVSRELHIERVAYVALCTNMRTVYPALVLFGQLTQVAQAQIDMLVMIPEELAGRTAELFQALGVKIWTLPRDGTFLQLDYPVQSLSTRRRDRILWNKLYAWKLVQYEKVILLDTDILILKGIDDLFQLNVHLAGVPALSIEEKAVFWDPPEPFEAEPLNESSWRNFTKPTRFEPYHSGLNGGVLLLRPGLDTFGELATAVRHLRERTCCPTQEFIYRFFELRGQYHRLPPVYNMRKLHKLSDEEKVAWQEIKIYHFVEKKKPWLLGRKASKAHKFENMWWIRADYTDQLLNVALAQDESKLATLRQARYEAISPPNNL